MKVLAKRVFDIFCGLIGILFFSPFLILVACIIKFSDSGSVFYRGIRVGLNGRLFLIYKFRTMIVDAEKYGGSSTAHDDQRITKFGKYLRKYELFKAPIRKSSQPLLKR